MELKKYQRAVIDDLANFLALLDKNMPVAESYRQFWEEKKVIVGYGGIQPYRNALTGVPNVCLKVPTGGGKTFIAANAIKPIFDALPFSKSKAVAWLVPSDAILEQTLKNLSDPRHPYRHKINVDFSHRVEVYPKNELLNGKNFNPTVIREQLSVFVLSYDSFRTSKKEGRKAYQENGNLAQFAKFFNDSSILMADTDETALIQVIRHLNPVVIVDESHHAVTPLSKEMLQNFNPSFVLDLTATPRKESNIISYVDALQLKKENMVKLPVIVYNRRSQADVLADAIFIRDKLEAQAQKERERTKRYIRPIVLLQAQPKNNDDSATFDKIKATLLEIGIPENQIAIKTANKNELSGVDLLDEACLIRYIITVNALKEGWDCPFAYVLATVANRTSVVDVEQILGRILRLPHTKRNESDVLNISYVVTSSKDFHQTLEKIVAGLNSAGFSDKDYRVSSAEEEPPLPPAKPDQIAIETIEDEGPSLDVDAIKARIIERQPQRAAPPEEDELFTRALSESAEYEESVHQAENTDIEAAPLEVRCSMNTFRMNEEFSEEACALRISQFVVPVHLPMFSEDKTTLLTRERLTEGISLRDKDTVIDFSALDAEIARVDIAETKDALPKAWKLTGADNQYFREWFNSLPPEKRIKQCRDMILKQLSQINAISDRDLADYVGRVINGLSSEQLEDLQQSPHTYCAKIKKKINALIDAHNEKNFDLWIEQGRITCEPTYALKSTISPVKIISTMPKSLYSSEEDMNSLEKDLTWELANMPNIKWWHRNISKTGFNINGYINAFPDIIAMTVNGKILMIEPKGDHLENADSRHKVKVGRVWQNGANKGGDKYRYYMVFKEKDLNIDGAVKFERFLEIVKGL